MKIKKNYGVYSGQPKFFVPINVLKLFKPRPPLKRKKYYEDLNSSQSSKKNNGLGIFSHKLSYIFKMEKSIGPSYLKPSFFFKRASEIEGFCLNFFQENRLQLISLQESKIKSFKGSLVVLKFLRDFSKKISRGKNSGNLSQFLKKKTLYLNLFLENSTLSLKTKLMVLNKNLPLLI